MKRLYSLIEKLDFWIERFEILILTASVAAMAVNSIANVVGRYIFNQSLFFTEELNQFLMILITFIGLSYVTRIGRHIRMSAIYDVLDDKIKKLLMLLICLATATVLFILAYYSFEYLLKLAQRGKVSPALRVPTYLTLVCLPVGFILTGIQYLLTFVQNLRNENIYISHSCIDTYEADEVDIELSDEVSQQASSEKN